MPDAELPYHSPSLAADLSGLPPSFVAVGALDLFLDDCLDYSLRLARAGVPVESLVYPGLFHGGDLLGDTALARRFAADRDRALGAMLRPRTRG